MPKGLKNIGVITGGRILCSSHWFSKAGLYSAAKTICLWEGCQQLKRTHASHPSIFFRLETGLPQVKPFRSFIMNSFSVSLLSRADAD
jgi:hypothetical protein